MRADINMDNWKEQLNELRSKVTNFDDFRKSDPVVDLAYKVVKNMTENVDKSNFREIMKNLSMMTGYYAYLEPVANKKNAEANIAYIAKKRYQAGTYLRIKQEIEKVTNETAIKMTDEKTYEAMAEEALIRLEADNYKSVCDVLKTAISVGQTILNFVRAEQFHKE